MMIRLNTIKRYISTNHLSSKFKVLGIESSCDDTCAAILDTDRNVLSNVKSSQIGNVIECGGVMTVSSIRLHSLAIHDVCLEALRKAKVKSFKELSAIAVTTRPGMAVSLDIGLNYAKRLSLNYDLPLIPIHHMEAHALTAMINNKKIKFPFLALLISGGHSQIALFKNLDLIFLLGNSNASGPGEMIDKIARQLKLKNLGSPFDRQSGGQSVEMLAKLIESQKDKKFKFSNMNRNTINNCDFNFGGFRNHFRKTIERLRKENLDYEVNAIKSTGFKAVDIDTPLDESCFICADLQFNLVNMITDRLERAIKFIEMSNILKEQIIKPEDIKLKEINLLDDSNSVQLDLVVSGGVACNDTIMNDLEQKLKKIRPFYDGTKLRFNLPRPYYLCTDNATMIAWNGILKFLDKNNRNYLLTDINSIKRLDKNCEAELGIDIRDKIKRLLI